MRAQSIRGGIVIEAVLILAGLALLYKAFGEASETYKFVHKAESVATDGVVQDTEMLGFVIGVRFVSAARDTVVFQQYSLLPVYKVGRTVPVVYDEGQMSTAVVDLASVLWFWPLLFAVPGFVLLIWGWRKYSVRNF